MYTIFISSLIGIITTLLLGLKEFCDWNWIWATLVGLAAFILANYLISRHFKKKIEVLMHAMQETLLTGQKAAMEQTNSWRFRSPGNIKQAQIEIMRQQKVYLEKALGQSKDFERFNNWVPLLTKQISTFRMQLHYQGGNFTEVDRLLPKCLYMEPITMAMKMVRMYKHKDAKLDDFFEKSVRRLRYGQGALLYGLRAWIALQQNDTEKALKTLKRATEKMENETIKYNLSLLENNKAKQFNLAGLGDEWYMLGLETPKVKYRRMPQRQY